MPQAIKIEDFRLMAKRSLATTMIDWLAVETA